MKTSKRIATLSVLTALGLLAFLIESLFPPLFLPGAKMGISNVFSLLTLILLGPADAVILVVVRTLLGSVFGGNVSSLIYSLSAGLVSIFVSILLIKWMPRISLIAVSVMAAVMHNLTQNVVFCLVSNTPQMYLYLPYLAVLGVVAGLVVGFAVFFLVKYLPLKYLTSMGFVRQNAPEAEQAEEAGVPVICDAAEQPLPETSAEQPDTCGETPKEEDLSPGSDGTHETKR